MLITSSNNSAVATSSTFEMIVFLILSYTDRLLLSSDLSVPHRRPSPRCCHQFCHCPISRPKRSRSNDHWSRGPLCKWLSPLPREILRWLKECIWNGFYRRSSTLSVTQLLPSKLLSRNTKSQPFKRMTTLFALCGSLILCFPYLQC